MEGVTTGRSEEGRVAGEHGTAATVANERSEAFASSDVMLRGFGRKSRSYKVGSRRSTQTW